MSKTALEKFMRKYIKDSRDTGHSTKAKFELILQKIVANMLISEKEHFTIEQWTVNLSFCSEKTKHIYITHAFSYPITLSCCH